MYLFSIMAKEKISENGIHLAEEIKPKKREHLKNNVHRKHR